MDFKLVPMGKHERFPLVGEPRIPYEEAWAVIDLTSENRTFDPLWKTDTSQYLFLGKRFYVENLDDALAKVIDIIEAQ